MPVMPKQKPGKSIQTYGTPWEFLFQVWALLGITKFDCDLAAMPSNRKCGVYLAPPEMAGQIGEHISPAGYDSLNHSWSFGRGWNWLNPPFARIGPWAAKACREFTDNRVQTAMLVPAGVGSNWWRDFVHRKAQVLVLNGRLVFEGTPINPKTGEPDPYPKDCALLLYGRAPGYWIWNWKQGIGGLS